MLTLIMLDIFMYYTPPHFFFRINLQDSIYKHVFTDSVEPDQLASEKPADLDLRCFQNMIYARLIVLYYACKMHPPSSTFCFSKAKSAGERQVLTFHR